MVGESKGSSRRSDGQYPVKPPLPGMYQSNHLKEQLDIFSLIDVFASVASRIRTYARYLARQKPNAFKTELSGRPKLISIII